MPSGLTFRHYDPGDERRRESLMALGNGRLHVRASAPGPAEGPHRYPAIYRAGLYDRQADRIAGERVENESLVRLPDGLDLTFRAVGAPGWFGLDAVTIQDYAHSLDVGTGLTERALTFTDPQGRRFRMRERRLVSMARPSLCALILEISPLGWCGALELRQRLDGAIENGNVERYRPYARRHLSVLDVQGGGEGPLILRCGTRQSGVELAVASRSRVTGEVVRSVGADRGTEAQRVTRTQIFELERGATLAVELTCSVATLLDPGAGDPVRDALAALESAPGFAALAQEQSEAWGDLWRRSSLTAAPPDMGAASRLHAFHTLQTVSPLTVAQDVGLPPRGWQEAYRGQVFWDELFVFPYLIYRFPEVARALLMYRIRRLGAARANAAQGGFRGAMFPWRSARTGQEETPRFQYNLFSGRWMRDPTHLQRHIGSAIAFNLCHYVAATGDDDFMASHGAELLLEIARFWASAAAVDPHSGRYDITGVVGPDEYHNAYPGANRPGLDTNAYTNVMAVWTLCRGLDLLARLPAAEAADLRRRLGLTPDELDRWEDVSRRMRIAFHGDGIISQFDGFDRLRPLDMPALRQRHPGRRVDWALEAEGETADAYQVTKQADVLTLFHLLSPDGLRRILGRLGYEVTQEQLHRTADYYLARCSHESSLSRIVFAGALARIDMRRSWTCFREAQWTDLDPANNHSTEEGVHIGAMAGSIAVLQHHYLGFGLGPDGEVILNPCLPPDLGTVRMSLSVRGRWLDLVAEQGRVGFTLIPEPL